MRWHGKGTYGVGLVANQVVNAVSAVGVDEAVADPLARAHGLVDVGDDLESGLDTIVVDLAGVGSLDVVLAREAEDVVGVLARQADELAAVGPVHLAGLDLNAAHEVAGRPVEERDTAGTAHTEQDAAVEAVCLEADVEAARLLDEVLVDLDGGGRLADSVVVAVLFAGPDKVQGTAEALLPPRQRGVDDVLAVARDGHEAAIGRVLQGLRVDLALAKVLRLQVDGVVVLGGRVGLDDGGDNVVVLGRNDLAGCVHGDGGLLTAHLDNDDTIVEADTNSLLALLVGHTPCALQAVAQGLLKAVGATVPDLDSAVLGTGDDDGQLRVVDGERDVVGVALESGLQRLGRQVPDLDGAVVGGCEDVGAVGVGVVVDVVNALCLVGLEGEVGGA